MNSEKGLTEIYVIITGLEHHQDFALPSFNAPSRGGTERLDHIRISRRSDPGVFIARAVTIPQPGAITARLQWHRAPQPLPPPPNLNP